VGEVPHNITSPKERMVEGEPRRWSGVLRGKDLANWMSWDPPGRRRLGKKLDSPSTRQPRQGERVNGKDDNDLERSLCDKQRKP